MGGTSDAVPHDLNKWRRHLFNQLSNIALKRWSRAQMADRPFEQSKGWPYGHPLLVGVHTALFFKRLHAGCTALWAAAFRLSGEKAVPAATATGYPLSIR